MEQVTKASFGRKISQRVRRVGILVGLVLLASVLVQGSAGAQAGGEQETVTQFYDLAGERAWNIDVRVRFMDSSPGKFISQTFDFSTGGGGFFGLQEDAAGQRFAIFSMWRNGLSGSANIRSAPGSGCDSHGESGGGVRCKIPLDWQDDRTYRLRLWRLQDLGQYERWGAWVIWGSSETLIGTIEVAKPQNRRTMVNNTYTFLMDFANQADCQAPAMAKVRVWQPTFNNRRATLDFASSNQSSCAAGLARPNPPGTVSDLSLGGTRIALVGKGGLCLTLPGNNQANGTNLEAQTCTGAPSQRWRQAPNGRIMLSGTGKCLDIEGPSTANWTPVQIWDCQNVPQHRWTVNTNGTIVGLGGKCLDIRNGSTTSGAAVQIYTCHTLPAQMEAQTWERVVP